jgi:regulatory protein
VASARTAAIALLSRRDYTRRELAQRLADRGHDAGEIDAALDGLAHERLVDDRRVAAAHVRTAAGVKGRGRRRIEQELIARGIDRAVARDALAVVSTADERAAVDRFLSRRGVPRRLDAPARRRLLQQLLRRGFPADVAAAALRAHGAAPDDEE